jgi:large subunit ribosomal protein L35
MPKMKTHRGAAKRFKITGSGAVKFKRAGMRHNLSAKTKAVKRDLRRTGIVDDSDHERVVRLLRGDG